MIKIGLVYLRIAVFVAITLVYATQLPGGNITATTDTGAPSLDNRQKQKLTSTTIEPPKPVIEVKEIGYAEIPNSNDNGGKNAILAAKLTNGVILEPDAVYSFNQIVGIRTPSRGFLDGQTVVNTVYGPEYVPGIGGGICRTSTAIHHAVLDAGLEVVERHNHSLPVSYSETGKDAAVAYGSLDYRFKNDTENPIKLMIETSNSKIKVRLLTILKKRDD